MDIDKAKEICNQFIDENKKRPIILHIAIETVLEELEIEQTNNKILQGELDRIGIDTLKLEKGSSTDGIIDEIKKKDAVIDEIVSEISCQLTILNKEIQEYVKQEAEKGEYTNLDEIIKQYFEKKVEDKSC